MLKLPPRTPLCIVFLSLTAGCGSAADAPSEGALNTASGGATWEDPGLGSGGVATGGSADGSGGIAPGSGGLAPGVGGDVSGAGGIPSTGGTSVTGGTDGSGGEVSSGGVIDSGSGGVAASGGTSGDGGAPAAGGAGSGGAVSGSGGDAGTCTVATPPAEFVETIEATWDEMTGALEARGAGARPPNASVLSFENTILDQIFENDGELSYCVRYESTEVLSAANRDKLEAALERNINEWIDQLEGQDCFPYTRVPVKVVGWAAMNRATFNWADGEHPGLMYIGDDSHEDAPQCAQECGRFFHREAGYQYPGCSGGRANHYDMSLWLTEGFQGGAGGDWGQRVGRSYFTGAIDQPTLHILSHEMGHGFGFPDYYNWSTWVPGVAAPHSIMVAGAALEVTDWDTWMIRRLWSELKTDRGF